MLDSSLQGILPVSENACENRFYSLAVNWDGTVSNYCVDWESQSVVGILRNSRLWKYGMAIYCARYGKCM